MVIKLLKRAYNLQQDLDADIFTPKCDCLFSWTHTEMTLKYPWVEFHPFSSVCSVLLTNH